MSRVLLTGATSGLGVVLVEQLASAGFSLLLHWHENEQKIEELCKKFPSARAVQGDFSTKEGVESFVERMDLSDVIHLINNMSLYQIGGPLETSYSDWLALFQSNFHAPIALMKACAPSLSAHRGAIVNLGTSGAERLWPDTYSSAYTLSKQALWSATRLFAKEFAKDQVRVNMVSPGVMENSVDETALPFARRATLEEVASMVCFLLAPENSYITGQNIEVAGGVRL